MLRLVLLRDSTELFNILQKVSVLLFNINSFIICRIIIVIIITTNKILRLYQAYQLLLELKRCHTES